MKVNTVRALLLVTCFFCCAGAGLAPAQQKKNKDCGRPVCPDENTTPVEKKRPPVNPTTRTTNNTRSPKPPGGGVKRAEPEEVCEELAEVLVRCGLPGCSVLLDGKPQGLTNESGEFLVKEVPRGARTVAISKQGYEGDSRPLLIKCGASETANLSLKIRPVKLRVRTQPPEAEVFVNDSTVPVGRSDARGILEFTVNTPRLLVTARKHGHLNDNSPVNVRPDAAAAQPEVVLTLKPIPAQLSLAANVAGARTRVDGEQPRPLTAEPVYLAPGAHRVEVEALGYATVVLELTTAPGETLKKSVTLERLGVAELTAQAETAYRERAHENVLTLAGYVFEKDAAAPAANRLAGLVYVARQDYARAEPHLAKALAGGETVELRVRRHAREGFELTKGHDACEGSLYLGKSELEYRGRQVTNENFKVPYAQTQVAGVLLRKNVAVYLATKVSDARGKKADYNFYGFDRELTAAGRAYLEMIQRLLRPH